MKEELLKDLRVFKKLCSLSYPDYYRPYMESLFSKCHSIVVLEHVWLYLTLKLFPHSEFSPKYNIRDFCIVYEDVPVEHEDTEVYLQNRFVYSWIADYVGCYYMNSANWVYRYTDNGTDDNETPKECFQRLFGQYLDERFYERVQEKEEKPEDLLCDGSIEWTSSMVFFKSLLLPKYEQIKRRIPRRLRYLKRAIEKAKRVLENFGADSLQIVTEEAVYFFSVLDEGDEGNYGISYVGIFSITPDILYAGKIMDECIEELNQEMHFL